MELDYKLQEVLDYKVRQSFKNWFTKCDGITKRGGLQKDTVNLAALSFALFYFMM